MAKILSVCACGAGLVKPFLQISRTILLLLALLGLAGGVRAQQTAPTQPAGLGNIPAEQVESLLDSEGTLTYDQVSASPWQERFESRRGRGLNFGVTQAAVWLRFRVSNPTQAKLRWILLADNPRLERVEGYIHAGGYSQRMVSGDGVPFQARALPLREIAFPLILPPGGQALIHLRIQTGATISVPLRMLTPDEFQRESRVSAVLLAGTSGFMSMLFLLTLLAWFRYRTRLMLAFLVMVFIQTMYTLIQDGLTTEYLWPDDPSWTLSFKIMLIPLLGPVALLYCAIALDFRTYAPRFYRPAQGLAALGVPAALLSFWVPLQVMNRTGTLMGGATALLLMAGIPYAWRRGSPAGRVIFWSGFPLIASALLVTAHMLGYASIPVYIVMHLYKATYLFFMGSQFFYALRHAWDGAVQPPTVGPETNQPPQEHAYPLSIYTLGQFQVLWKEKPVRFTSRGVSQIQVMLAMIAAGGAAGTTRGELVDHLWPEDEGDNSETNLRTALYRLRQLIGKEALIHSDQRYRLSSDVAWEDSQHFEAAARAVLSGAAASPDPQSVLNLYGGDFLPGFQAPIIVRRRETLRALFQRLVLFSADQHAAQGDYPAALAVVEQAFIRNQPDEKLSQKITHLKGQLAAIPHLN